MSSASEPGPTFVAELFQGRFRPEHLFPYPEPGPEERRETAGFVDRLRAFLEAHVDADAVDRDGELPDEVVKNLFAEGFFGLKIPHDYGGAGLSQSAYMRVIECAAMHCSSTATWLAAHQSIGVPQPLLLFGTEEQKRRYLPQLACEKLSGFALTEPEVGSDPGDMRTTAEPLEDGASWVLNGEKLWCTNGTAADFLVVMARTPPRVVDGKEKPQITAFLVACDAPGVEVVHRCQFLGVRGLANGLLRLTDVRVPAEDILLGEGRGLKVALATLNTGRLTLPAAATAAAKVALRTAREWAATREQWGQIIGKHEAVAAKLARIAATTFAMDAVTWHVAGLLDRGQDIRSEAAMAKLFTSEAAIAAVDDALQVRGGRGYETRASMAARAERLPEPIERLYRDVRINTIIEGSSEIIRLFLARELLGDHACRMRSPLKALPHYLGWYPAQHFSWRPWRTHSGLGGPLAPHLRWMEHATHRLARATFHALVRNGARLQRRQLLLGRLVDVATELFVMGSSISRARSIEDRPERQSAHQLADLFCRQARRRIEAHLGGLRRNADACGYRTARAILEDGHRWLES